MMTGIFALVAVFLLSSLWLLSALLQKRKYGTKFGVKSTESTEEASKGTEIKAHDVGVLGTLKLAWQLRASLWDDIPGYERAVWHHEKYGKLLRYIYTWDFKNQIVLLADLKLIKRISCSSAWLNRTLDSHKHYIHSFSFNKPLGVLFGNGPHWKESRKILMKLLREHKLFEHSHLEELYCAEGKLLLGDLHAKIERNGSSGKGFYATFSPRHMFAVPIMNIIFKTLFGRRMSPEERVKGGLLDQLHHMNSTFVMGLSSLEYFPFLKYFPNLTSSLRRFTKCSQTAYDIAKAEATKRQSAGTYVTEPKDMMDSLLIELDAHAGNEPNYFTFESLQVAARDLIFAGGETIGAAIQHVILYIALHAEVQRKIQAEIDQVIGPDRLPTYDDKKSMIYTQATILECLRMGSVVPVGARTCTQDYDLCDLKIKTGTLLIPNFYVVNHSLEYWEEPLVFRPERFLNERNEIVNTENLLPFSLGPRACPGELPARVALFMFTVLLLREFVWEISPEHPPPSMRNTKGLTRYPDTYFVKIQKRTANNL